MEDYKNSLWKNEVENPQDIQNNNQINDEAGKLDKLASHNDEVDSVYQEEMSRHWTFLDRITNPDMYKEVSRLRKKLIQTSSNYRLEIYETLMDARLGALRERCDAGLKMIQGHYRHKVSSYLMAKMEELSKEVTQHQMLFIRRMEQKYVEAQSISVDSLRKRYLDKLDQEEARHMDFLESLLAKFENIVREKLG